MDILYINALITHIEQTIITKYNTLSNASSNIINKITVKVYEQNIDTDVYCDTIYYMLSSRMRLHNIQINDIVIQYPRSIWCCSGGYIILNIYFEQAICEKEYRVSI